MFNISTIGGGCGHPSIRSYPTRSCMVVKGGPTFTRALVREVQHARVAGVRQGQSSRFRRRRDADADVERVLATAKDDATQRAHVAVIASPGERHMAVGRHDVVRGIEIYPAQPWTPD